MFTGFISFIITVSAIIAVLLLLTQALIKICARLLRYLSDSSRPAINRLALFIAPSILAAYYLIEDTGNTALLTAFIMICCFIAGYCFYKFLKIRKN